MENRMRIGVVSDTHVSGDALEFARKAAERFSGVDLILHAGDQVVPGVTEHLAEIAPVVAVRGNMDCAAVRDRLRELEILELEGFRIGLIHGTGPGDHLASRLVSRLEAERLDVLVFGHSHEPYEDLVGGVLCVNPGSATRPRAGHASTAGILTLGEYGPEWQLVELDCIT
jgi:putative phosphoesterase